MRVIDFAKVVPDGRFAGNDVRLIAAIADDVMRPLLRAQMLPAIVPPNIHQLNGVKRAAASPGSGGRMSRFTGERVFDRNKTRAACGSVADVEIIAHVSKETDVDILEVAIAHEIGLCSKQLFGYARPDHQSSGNLLAFHELLHRDRCRD